MGIYEALIRYQVKDIPSWRLQGRSTELAAQGLGDQCPVRWSSRKALNESTAATCRRMGPALPVLGGNERPVWG